MVLIIRCLPPFTGGLLSCTNSCFKRAPSFFFWAQPGHPAPGCTRCSRSFCNTSHTGDANQSGYTVSRELGHLLPHEHAPYHVPYSADHMWPAWGFLTFSHRACSQNPAAHVPEHCWHQRVQQGSPAALLLAAAASSPLRDFTWMNAVFVRTDRRCMELWPERLQLEYVCDAPAQQVWAACQHHRCLCRPPRMFGPGPRNRAGERSLSFPFQRASNARGCAELDQPHPRSWWSCRMDSTAVLCS